ncbi:MAG TPA: ATP-binding cassette domain-containing protein, partial [Candidatus Limnocylindrales bacterium]|nr:ATP-binding cassette domain-containing protein [Candidatus Limnocylindrales bacterium]
MSDARPNGHLLELDEIHAYYGNIRALRGVSLHVDRAEIVTLIGSNGAGKSTTLKTISGVLKPRKGEVRFDGRRIDELPAHEIVKLGVAQAPEGRRVFSRMTVFENLLMGAFSRRGVKLDDDVTRVFDLFPRLH